MNASQYMFDKYNNIRSKFFPLFPILCLFRTIILFSYTISEYINEKQEYNMKQKENKNWNRVEIK